MKLLSLGKERKKETKKSEKLCVHMFIYIKLRKTDVFAKGVLLRSSRRVSVMRVHVRMSLFVWLHYYEHYTYSLSHRIPCIALCSTFPTRVVILYVFRRTIIIIRWMGVLVPISEIMRIFYNYPTIFSNSFSRYYFFSSMHNEVR